MFERHAFAAGALATGAGCRWVLFYLADRANPSGVCWPKVETIAKHVGLTESQVGRCLAGLEDDGLIARVRLRSGGRLRGWLFRVLVPGSLPVDREDLPRWMGDLELPGVWLEGVGDAARF